MQIDRFTNQIKFKQLIGILRNSRPHYRAALCGFNIHNVIYDAAREYNPTNWHQLILELPHAAKDGLSIAYYSKDANVGKTATVTKIGKYIKRHFPMIPDNVIRDIATPYLIKAEFIDDLDQIIKIMESDDVPKSCMTKEFNIHPYRVYNPEFGWRLCVKKQGDEIIGRALVNGFDFVRAYTTSTSSRTGISIDCALETWLESQGYTLRTSWPSGTKIDKIETGSYSDDIVAPYIDGNRDQLEDCGSYLRIVSDGDYTASGTDGTAEHNNKCSCEHCGDRMSDDDSTYIENYGSVCPSCVDSDFIYIESVRIGGRYIGGNYISKNDAICTIDGNYYPECDYGDFDIVELHDGRYTNIDDTVFCESDDQYYLSDDIGDLIAYCEDLDEYSTDFWECAESNKYYSDDQDFAYNADGDKIHPDYADDDLILVTETNGV